MNQTQPPKKGLAEGSRRQNLKRQFVVLESYGGLCEERTKGSHRAGMAMLSLSRLVQTGAEKLGAFRVKENSRQTEKRTD